MIEQQIEQQQVSSEEEKAIIISPNCNIRDLRSFNVVTGNNREIAGLYFYYMLDHLIDITYTVAKDFSTQRFHLFTSNDPKNAIALLRLYTRLGNDEIFLSREHRHTIWHSLFGHPISDPTGDRYNFPELRDKLLETASEYVNRAEVETGAPALIESVRLALISWRQYLEAVQGAATKLYRSDIFPQFTENNVYQILRDPNVTAVYGINIGIRQEWPYAFDTNANKVIEEISCQLMVKDDKGMKYTQKIESYLETAAKRGACAIAASLETDPDSSSDAEIVSLISKCHAWRTALQFLETYGTHRNSGHTNNGKTNGMNGQAEAMNGSQVQPNQNVISAAAYRR
jgi:hypothetical protein